MSQSAEQVRAQVACEMRRALHAWMVGTNELADLYLDIGQPDMTLVLRKVIVRVSKVRDRQAPLTKKKSALLFEKRNSGCACAK